MDLKWFEPKLKRIANSAVAWSWIYNLFRLGSGLLLLPLLLRKVSREEIGVYYMFLAIGQFAWVIDFGFAGTFGRFVSYATSGARRLEAFGLSAPHAGSSPNVPLLWELLFTTRMLYRALAGASLVLLSLLGTPFLLKSAGETPNASITWAAWILTIIAVASELYCSWWNIFLSSMNRVIASNRILAISYSLRLAFACGLLLFGAGLLSVPLGSIAASFLQRHLSRTAALSALDSPPPEGARDKWRQHMHVIWPNTWRLGLQLSSRFLATSLSPLICSAVFGTVVTGQLGIAMQMIGFVQSMANVWTAVKWPLISQLRARNEVLALQAIFWPRVWLQNLSYIAGALAIYFWGAAALKWLGTDKQMIAQPWIAVLAVNGFLETQFLIWGTLISTENRLPYLWPSVAANLGSVALALVLLFWTSLGVGAFVLAPLIAGIVFNYWYWPIQGAKSINTSLGHFLLSGAKP